MNLPAWSYWLLAYIAAGMVFCLAAGAITGDWPERWQDWLSVAVVLLLWPAMVTGLVVVKVKDLVRRK